MITSRIKRTKITPVDVMPAPPNTPPIVFPPTLVNSLVFHGITYCMSAGDIRLDV